MNGPSKTPSYNLKVVIRETGLKVDIKAGLSLGDLNLLEYEVDWLAGFLKTHDVPSELLPKYLMLYKQAVEANLDRRGQPVIEWLDSVLGAS